MKKLPMKLDRLLEKLAEGKVFLTQAEVDAYLAEAEGDDRFELKQRLRMRDLRAVDR